MKMQTLTDRELVQYIREAYEEKLNRVNEELNVMFPIDGQKSNVLSKGLKIHDKSGKLYTIDSIGDWGAMLIPASKSDSGGHIKVSVEELENEYEL